MFGRLFLLTSLVCLSAVQAIFFGGGGGGGCCQPSCCQPQPSCSSCCPPPPPAPSCGCSQPQYIPPPPPPPPQQCSCAQPQPCGYGPQQQSYAAPQQSCQPRYIIVRPVEHTSQVGTAPSVSYQPSAPAVSYQQPSGGASYQTAPVQSAPQASYQAAPAPIQVPAPPASSYQGAPPPPPADTGSYKTGGYKARASKTILLDSRCNSNELRQVLVENIVADDANESKRRVHKAANEEFTAEEGNGGIDVICAPGAFSYRIATDFFCEQSKGNITCFAYQQHA
uniref:Ground-like domain-containing protein n=1 Tax=Ditylenchus dipsaci TaxID=166011 RepID=A0A915CMW3_9BILA